MRKIIGEGIFLQFNFAIWDLKINKISLNLFLWLDHFRKTLRNLFAEYTLRVLWFEKKCSELFLRLLLGVRKFAEFNFVSSIDINFYVSLILQNIFFPAAIFDM